MIAGVYCDDWGCKMWQSCVHAFGRSDDYAGMKRGAEVSSCREHWPWKRKSGSDKCDRYEFDPSMCWFERPMGLPVHHKPGRA